VPLHDFHCAACGLILQDQYRSIEVGGQGYLPRCQRCGEIMEWIIPVVAMDVGGVKGAAFKAFTIHRQVPTREGLMQVEEQIDSVHKLRQIEKDSEQRYRDGEGEPLRFRGYNQDASNKDVNSFGVEGSIGARQYDSGKTPQKKKNVDVKRHGEKKPSVKVARGAGVSALKGGR